MGRKGCWKLNQMVEEVHKWIFPLGKHLWKVLNDSSLCPEDNANEKLLKMMLRWLIHLRQCGNCIVTEERCDQARDGRDGLVSNTYNCTSIWRFLVYINEIVYMLPA